MKHSVRVNLGKHLTDGRCSLRLRVSWNGQRADKTLDNAVALDQWDNRTSLPKRSARRAYEEVMRLTADIDRVFDTARLERRIPDKGEVLAALGNGSEKPSKSVELPLHAFMLSLASDVSLSGAWSDNTRRNYLHLCRMVKKWDCLITASAFSRDDMAAFLEWCFQTGHINPTVMKFAKQLRWTLRIAAERGNFPPSDALLFRPRYKVSSDNEIVFLDRNELSQFASVDLSSLPHLERSRDVFLFCCFSGLRYSDVAKLRKVDVHADHIRVVTKKTADPLTIELNDMTRAILGKYGDEEGELALPIISNQRYNEYLKVIGRRAGIDTPVMRVWWVRNERHTKSVPKWQVLTSHSGRRTFIVTALSLSIAGEVIMKWTGHKDFQSMKPYIAIVDELKRTSMTKFDAFGELAPDLSPKI